MPLPPEGQTEAGGYNLAMKLLAIDTSTERCSVALTLNDAIHADDVEAGQRHSELLNGMIMALLARHGLMLRDVHGFAFGSGPGSFTGLRIACGVVQGMAYALDRKVAPVGTLEALAEQSDADKVITALDARMGETYFAAWQREGQGWQAIVPPCLATPATLPKLDGNDWTGIGSAFDRHDYVRQHFAANIRNVMSDRFPHARDIAAVALRIFARDGAVTADQAMPLYIRDKVALTIEERKARKQEATA